LCLKRECAILGVSFSARRPEKMAEPQNIRIVATADGKLGVSWTSFGTANGNLWGILVGASADADFRTQSRYFLVPPTVSGVNLSVGSAAWFVRVGAMVGTENQGKIAWSRIYGPTVLEGQRPICEEPANALQPVHTQAVFEGFRIHTGNYEVFYAFTEVSKEDKFSAGQTKWHYVRHAGRGYVDATGLEFPNRYAIRFRYVKSLPSLKADEMETTTTTTTTTVDGVTTTQTVTTTVAKPVPIVPLPAGKEYKQVQSARPTRYNDSMGRSIERADSQLLHEATFNKNMKFASHTDYLRYVAAQARSGKEKISG
jgi:hypothetical protein